MPNILPRSWNLLTLGDVLHFCFLDKNDHCLTEQIAYFSIKNEWNNNIFVNSEQLIFNVNRKGLIAKFEVIDYTIKYILDFSIPKKSRNGIISPESYANDQLIFAPGTLKLLMRCIKIDISTNITRARMDKGDVLDLTLPSGSRINVEVTQDTASIVLDDGRIIFNEDYNYGDLAGPVKQWIRDIPKPE